MSVYLFINNHKEEFTSWTFPGGEVGVKYVVDNPESVKSVFISISNVPKSDDLILVANIIDCLNRQGVSSSLIDLLVPYFPYARQDRACSIGESFALEVFIKMLSTIENYRALVTMDLHSTKTLELLNKYLPRHIVVNELEQIDVMHNLPKIFDNIIAPDKGAAEKAKHIQPEVSHHYLTKERKDGKVVTQDYEYDTIVGSACIVDDILDGGATFIEAAKMLRRTQPRLKHLYLAVTHGILSKGYDVVKEHFNDIYVANAMTDEAKKCNRINIL